MQQPENLIGEFINTKDTGKESENGPVVKVNQVWIDRMVNFVKAYTEVISINDVENCFKKSEIQNFNLFLQLNGLVKIRDLFIKIKTNTMVLLESEIRRAYQKVKNHFKSFEDFLTSESILYNSQDKTYYRIILDFPKIKFVEILGNIPWKELTLSMEHFFDIMTLMKLFDQDEIFCYSMIALGYNSGIWKIVDPYSGLEINENLKNYLSNGNLGLGIEFNPDDIECLQEWINFNLDLIAKKQGKN